ISREEFALQEIEEEIGFQKEQMKKLTQSIKKLNSTTFCYFISTVSIGLENSNVPSLIAAFFFSSEVVFSFKISIFW
ncbi:hypothetical protein Q604_UNBC17197G0001, partial [human gut metagenome]